MNSFLNQVTVGLLLTGVFLGVRYVGAAIHYGCANPAEDCPPPIYGAGQLGYYLTGGDLIPLGTRN